MKVDFDHENMSEEELIKELALVNEKLVEAEQVKTDFLSNIKNEINNPMTSILGLLKMVISNPDDHEGNLSKAKLIYNEVNNLNFQIQNVFIAAEIEAGHAFPEVSQVNVRTILEDVMHAFENNYQKKHIALEWRHEGDEKFISDRDKLQLIVSNLLSNAIKFSNENSKIYLTTMNETGQLTLIVQDKGVGIEKDHLVDIFDRFKQLDSGTKKSFAGHGLGLSIVHSLVDILDGELFIESELGQGATFKIVLPSGTKDESEMDFYSEDDAIFFDSGEESEEVF